MIKVLELFAGIGACSKALTNLGIEHEIVDAVEIDKYAIKSFNAIHGTNFEPQDITKWDKDIKADLIMHGSPCQDFSVAGKNAGGDEGSGTRSSLLYETLRIVEKVHPDIVIWENVKNLLSKRHKHNHEAYIERMNALGYDSVTQILNAKDYGVPQNRERVFTLSIKRGSKLVKSYTRPEPRPLEIRLKDMLEKEVDEKYYLSDEQVSKIKFCKPSDGISKTIRAGGRGSVDRHSWDIVASDSLAKAVEPLSTRGRDVLGTLRASMYKQGLRNLMQNVENGRGYEGVAIPIRTANKQGYDLAQDGDGIDLAYPESKTRRGRVGHGVSKTIPTGGGR